MRGGGHSGGEAAGEIADVCRRPPKQLAPRKRPKREAALGGKGIPQNGRPLANATGEHKAKSCEDNRKAKRADRIGRTNAEFWARIAAKAAGETPEERTRTRKGNRPMPGGRRSGIKIKMRGREAVRRDTGEPLR